MRACAGPCIGMDTACSSSLVATHLAHRGLLDGETTAALAAGVNLILVPDTSRHMAQLGALSPTGRSKSLDAAADGYGRGEGCVVLALRRSGERADGAYAPLAILQGLHNNCRCNSFLPLTAATEVWKTGDPHAAA